MSSPEVKKSSKQLREVLHKLQCASLHKISVPLTQTTQSKHARENKQYDSYELARILVQHILMLTVTDIRCKSNVRMLLHPLHFMHGKVKDGKCPNGRN